jgi:hypothetical protein
MIIDPNGKHWIRSEDLTELVCEDGRKVIGNADMTDEYLLSVAFIEATPEPIVPSESDRIAELEAQVKALLAKLS